MLSRKPLSPFTTHTILWCCSQPPTLPQPLSSLTPVFTDVVDLSPSRDFRFGVAKVVSSNVARPWPPESSYHAAIVVESPHQRGAILVAMATSSNLAWPLLRVQAATTSNGHCAWPKTSQRISFTWLSSCLKPKHAEEFFIVKFCGTTINYSKSLS